MFHRVPFILFKSNVRGKNAAVPITVKVVSRGEAGLMSTPQDPFEKVIALGLFDFLSEAISVILTVTWLLCKIEDINDCYCHGKSV